jgi:hypothetical protein
LILVLFCSYIFAAPLLPGHDLGLVCWRRGGAGPHEGATLGTVINNGAFVLSTIYVRLFACYKLEQHRRVSSPTNRRSRTTIVA